jgi:hypothetical protein
MGSAFHQKTIKAPYIVPKRAKKNQEMAGKHRKAKGKKPKKGKEGQKKAKK